MNPYRVYSEELVKTFGEKVYKIPVQLPCTCPNRDALLGTGGCIFCGDEAAGFEALPDTQTITEQAKATMALIEAKYKAKAFILYFQNYTNTYMALDRFKAALAEALAIKGLVGIAISTRPDCIGTAQLEALNELAEAGLKITIELGLQTPNFETLQKLNRGHGVASFVAAVQKIHAYGFSVCAHLILNLPWDGDDTALEAAALLSALKVEEVKLHSLYILKDTKLGELYTKGALPPLISAEAYQDRVIRFMEHLHPDCVVQRFFARAPEDKSLFCNWGTSWRKLKDQLDARFEELQTYQGRLYRDPSESGLKEGMR